MVIIPKDLKLVNPVRKYRVINLPFRVWLSNGVKEGTRLTIKHIT